MTLLSQLRETSSAIVDRWLRDTLATYPEDTATAFQRNKDPFTNPVGHALRVGTQAAVEALLDGRDAQQVCACLDEVIRIRAIQEFSPSQALAFIFLLKRAIRVEWSGAASGSMAKNLISELEDLDARIDRTALQAFDVYLGYRKRVYELRVNEVKRSVAKLIERVNSGKGGRPTYEDLVQLTVPECPEVQRGRD